MQQLLGKDLQDFVKAHVGNATKVEFDCLVVHLSRRFWVEAQGYFEYTLQKGDCNPCMELLETDSLKFEPKEFILADAKETFFLPDNIKGVLGLRSYAAQRGLEQSSSLILKPGWAGSLKLELMNSLRRHSLILSAGDPIASIEFFRLDTELELWEAK